MIVVAITQRLTESPDYPETRDCLDIRWAELLGRIGIALLPLPTRADPSLYFRQFSPSGVVFTGGNDLSTVSGQPLSAIRDAFEHKVLALALELGVPVFAVCRGMQLLAQHYGARVTPVLGHTRGAEHTLSIDATTSFGRILGPLGAVLSYHDYAVASVPCGFRAVARSTDGTLEAIEHETLPIFAQMWHPEREMTRPASSAAERVLRHLLGRPLSEHPGVAQ